ncbi:hypothetical protein [Nonlabens antarcticus]|uniref:hypothetical protein n=1 Tax=Nonlabens antarcticus TaxID=392714 RepID=UPI001891BA12|nr:hypothetical protein [Nonlabens antarcticus]
MKENKSKSDEKLPYNSDITAHDKDILRQGNKNLHRDGGADQQLVDRKKDADFAGNDLDIPGRNEAQKGHGPKGLNDEENKLHSQGGDSKNNLERDDAAK